ncbi:head-tail connector protein [Novosphingobium sp. ST904]|uniref:head-tail connector protein n=1 Tax=Novosphingobium sp. ST904 TaxID=1684385 RepID=UPI0006CD0746|nr:head-tail connector protein [Novosphingobium sp. ST904]KPH66897.1 hypothetical protein ADT71_03860 [Novosphingobium sp. ST904]
MRVVVVTPPAPVVTLDEAKSHLRVRHNDEDALIEAYVTAATAHIDGPAGWLGRSIGEQVLEARFSLIFEGNANEIRLPFGPVVELVGVRYRDYDETEQDADLADFELAGDTLRRPGRPSLWEGGSLRDEAATVQYRTGYAEPPAPIRAAILMMVGDLYANRETVAIGASAAAIPMSTAPARLLSLYRVFT